MTYCRDCVRTHAQLAIVEQRPTPLLCPALCLGPCGAPSPIPPAVLATVLSQPWQNRLRGLAGARTDPRMRMCPSEDCWTFSRGDPDHPDMVCSGCQLAFCYYHGADHSGRPCERRPPAECLPPLRTLLWRAWHTKKCPGCGTHIEKNGGCPHMSCSHCRHQFCWDCKGRWNPPGGYHQKKVFFWPSEFSSTCNSPGMWALRLGAVALAPVAVGLAVPVAAVGLVGAPFYFGAKAAKRSYESYRVEQRLAAQRQRRQEIMGVDGTVGWDAAPVLNAEACGAYYRRMGGHCRTCSASSFSNESLLCSHEYIIGSVGPSAVLCSKCGHFRGCTQHIIHPTLRLCQRCGVPEAQAWLEERKNQAAEAEAEAGAGAGACAELDLGHGLVLCDDPMHGFVMIDRDEASDASTAQLRALAGPPAGLAKKTVVMVGGAPGDLDPRPGGELEREPLSSCWASPVRPRSHSA